MNLASDHTIIVSPVGKVENALCEHIGKQLRQKFGFQTDVADLLNDMEFALNAERRQYQSTPILEKLAIAAPEKALKVLAITDVDLFIPILTHVYGEAQLGGKAAIVSTFRLKDDLKGFTADAFEQRIAKEAIHELGHTFNLLHCKDHQCIMHYCRSLRDVDRKTDSLCRYCRTMLEDEVRRIGNLEWGMGTK